VVLAHGDPVVGEGVAIGAVAAPDPLYRAEDELALALVGEVRATSDDQDARGDRRGAG
jgi:hypothetical protein